MGKTSKKEEEKTIVSDIIAAQAELDALKREHGIEDEEKGIKKAVTRFFDKRAEQTPLNKKKYLMLALITGIFGGHRFYAKQYPTAILYLLTFWSGFSFAMTLVDLLIVIPKKPDENGDIFL